MRYWRYMFEYETFVCSLQARQAGISPTHLVDGIHEFVDITEKEYMLCVLKGERVCIAPDVFVYKVA